MFDLFCARVCVCVCRVVFACMVSSTKPERPPTGLGNKDLVFKVLVCFVFFVLCRVLDPMI